MTKDASITMRGKASPGICSSVHRAENSKNLSVEACIETLCGDRKRA